MGKVIYWVHASVDGYVDGPKGEFDWPLMGPELSAYSEKLDERVGALLYGRTVWEMMVGYWPDADSLGDHPHTRAFAPFWRATPKVVVSRTYPGDEWTSQVISTNLADEIRALVARTEGDILLTGGSALAASLTALGLIDEYHVAVHPVVLGGGRPLFADTTERRSLRVAASRVLDGRVVATEYHPVV